MEGDRFISFALRVATLIGLWSNGGGSKIYRNVARFNFISMTLLNILFKLLLIPKIKDIQDAIEIFLYLPTFITFLFKYINFVMKTDKVSELMLTLNELYSELDQNPSLKFAKFPIHLKIQTFLNSIAPIYMIVELFAKAFTHSLKGRYWIPEAYEDSEFTFWLYFTFERISSTFITCLIIGHDLVIPLFLVHLKRCAKLHTEKLRSLDLKDLPKVHENHKKFKKLS